MKYLIYSKLKRNLIYDQLNYLIKWSDIKPDQEADRLVLQNILKDYIHNLVESSNDIQLLFVNPIQDIIFMDTKLYIDEIFVGYLSSNIKKVETRNIEKNGGLVILSLEDREVLKLIPNYNNSLRVDIKNDNNLTINKQSDTDYIETTIKIPKRLIESNESETIKRILDSNIQIYRQVSKLSDNVERINDELLFRKRDTEEIKIYKEKNENLMLEIEMLRRERHYLEKEIEQSEIKALNKLKNGLKQSQIAIERHIDLEDFPVVKQRIKDIILNLFKDDFPIQEIEKILSNEDKLKELDDFSDNIDAKIQSLKEIRGEFIHHKIIGRLEGEI
ncbi:hypothetical protein ABET51_17120 [Metabacillus fastidiosus]|uniref:hypothetical protein n=1 Tax=Metabacillus fastidiosus TaxID=1458 RepID=UPI003D29C5FC